MSSDALIEISLDDEFPAIPHSRWMQAISGSLQGRELRQIVLIGSHDAGTGGAVSPYQLVPDRRLDEKIYKVWSSLNNTRGLKWAGRLVARTVARLSRTQLNGSLEQLRAGSRYFDLRLYRQENGEVALTHGIVGETMTTMLRNIRSFLSENPGEVIILQERQREGFDHDTYLQYIEQIKQILGDLLVPNDFDCRTTYGVLMQTQHRVIYVAPEAAPDADPLIDNVGFRGDPLIWSHRNMTTYWPNAQSVKVIQQRFGNKFREWANEGTELCAAQLIYSPTTAGYVRAVVTLRSLENISESLDKALPQLINDWAHDATARLGMNVLMIDFVEAVPEVVDEVIHLNR